MEISDHHQGFNSSIGTFHSIMRSITTSQAKVRALRESLVQAKTDLSASKPEVKNMVETSQTYDKMLRTLNLMFAFPRFFLRLRFVTGEFSKLIYSTENNSMAYRKN